jgi:hypothetical protein
MGLQTGTLLGLPPTLAGIQHASTEATGSGHCALPRATLVQDACKLLEVEELIVQDALTRLLVDRLLILESLGGQDLVYLPYLRRAEEGIAGLLRKLAGSPSFCRRSTLKSDRPVPAQYGERIGADAKRGLTTSVKVPRIGHHWRARGRENHPGGLDPANLNGEKAHVSVMPADRPRGQALG